MGASALFYPHENPGASVLPEPQLRFFVRLLQLEKILPPLPTVNDSLTAAFFGIEVDRLSAVRASLAEEVRHGSDLLMADAEVSGHLDALKFQDGDVVVGLGDSLTADGISWFELLAQAFKTRFPGKKIQFVNAGVSGDSTPQILARVSHLVPLNPTHVLCLAGGNDARRFGSPDAKVQVSKGETARNLALLQTRIPNAQWLWIAPPGVDEERAAKSPFWASMAVFWQSHDINEISELIGHFKNVVDLRSAVAVDDPALVGDDGLHPTLVGHIQIARAVLAGLVG